MGVFALGLADKPSRFKYMKRKRRKLGKEQWFKPVGRLRGKSSMQKSTGSAGLGRRKDGGVPLGCPFMVSLWVLPSGFVLSGEGTWARLGPAGAEQRQPLAPVIVSGVPGAGGSHQEVWWEGCSGCGGSLSSCARCPWHSRCVFTFPFSWRELLWATVCRCCCSVPSQPSFPGLPGCSGGRSKGNHGLSEHRFIHITSQGIW